MKIYDAMLLGGRFYALSLKQAPGQLLQLTYILLVFCLALFSLSHTSIQQYLNKNLEQMLGADTVISLPRAIEPETLQSLHLQASELSVTRQVDLTLTFGDKWQRAQLKVVDEHYPLKGQLVKSDSLEGQETKTSVGPAQGEIWLDPRLFKGLGIGIGDTLAIQGEQFKVTGILHYEPDRLMEGHSVEMRGLIGASQSLDIDWEQYSSRFRYLVNHPDSRLGELQEQVKSSLPEATLLNKSGDHPLALFFKRSENFLGLSSVLLFLMGALAIDLVSRRTLTEKSRRFALIKSMGASDLTGLAVLICEWLCLLGAGLLVGTGLAWLVQYFLAAELATYLPGFTPQISWTSLVKLFVLLSALFSLFQLPAWALLSTVSINSLLRNHAQQAATSMRILCSVAGLALISVVYTDNPLLTAMTLGALLVTCLIVCLVTWLSLTSGERVLRKYGGLLGFSFYLMKQRLVSKTAQILGIGLCATLMIFTFMLMHDLGKTMERYQRSHDGNFFISQMKQDETPSLNQWADKYQSQVKELRPYYSASMVAVNGVALDELPGPPSDSKARLKRPVRVHWNNQVPDNNTVTDGEYWDAQPSTTHQVSVESEVMVDVGLSLGDTLTFSFNGKTKDFVIVASHVFKPGNGSITFWFQIPQSAADEISAQAFVMGSMEIPQNNWHEVVKLWQQIPSLRAISLQELTASFDATLDTMKKAVSGFTLMIALLGAIVIFAAVKGFEVSERTKIGLMLSFGKTKGDCLRLTMYEWGSTALIGAVGAILGTWLFGTLIYQSQFSMTYKPDLGYLFGALTIILAIVCTLGMLACRNSLNIRIKNLIEANLD